jgi:hypothetical protein
MNIRRVVVAGLIASAVMGMIEMLAEAVLGTGFWSPVTFIGATVLRSLQSVQVPVPFTVVGVLLGLMGHMMNSVLLGLVFAGLFSRGARSRAGLVMTGAVYGFAVFAVMWYRVLPVVDPVMLKLNATVFAISHFMWGAVLGILVPQTARATVKLQNA